MSEESMSGLGGDKPRWKADVELVPRMTRKIAGCGWTAEIAETTGCPEPTRDNDSPCCARDGNRSPSFDNPTVGLVGLCIGCLEAPADLLAKWSAAMDNATETGGE